MDGVIVIDKAEGGLARRCEQAAPTGGTKRWPPGDARQLPQASCPYYWPYLPALPNTTRRATKS
jgi:hypothetical protein